MPSGIVDSQHINIMKHKKERILERSSHNILPMDGLAGKITSSLHESNFACYIAFD